VESFNIILQVTLAAVLMVAAIGKFLDLPGARQAVRDFGVPERYATALGSLLPVVEALLAVGLLVTPLIRWAALGTFVLFVVFIAAIAWNLRQGRQPNCHCFGQIHSEPAGPSTLIRNTVLALATLPLIWTGGQGIPSWVGDLSDGALLALALGLAIAAVGGLQLWLTKQLLRQNARILARLEALSGVTLSAPEPSSEPDLPKLAPDFDLPRIDGGRLRLGDLLAKQKPLLIVFASPNCGPCRALMPDIAEWARRFGDDIELAVISTGEEEAIRDHVALAGLGNVARQEGSEVADAYGVRGTPAAVS
jgi:thiol-disulfide isomerase/thioredoxin/uncharacterized membrane protein YphA (DoxX/SURF4 family)